MKKSFEERLCEINIHWCLFATLLKEEESDNEENFIDLNVLKAQTYRSVS